MNFLFISILNISVLQMVRRRTHDKLPLQGNYFPLTSMVYIEDKEARFSVLSAQSLGCAGLQTGKCKVFMKMLKI